MPGTSAGNFNSIGAGGGGGGSGGGGGGKNSGSSGKPNTNDGGGASTGTGISINSTIVGTPSKMHGSKHSGTPSSVGHSNSGGGRGGGGTPLSRPSPMMGTPGMTPIRNIGIGDGGGGGGDDSFMNNSTSSTYQGMPDPTTWTTDNVVAWAQLEGIGRYASLLQEHQIDGMMLFELDDQMLQDDLGISSRLDRRRLLVKRDALGVRKPQREELSESFTERPRTLHTLIEQEDLQKLLNNRHLDRLQMDLRKGRFGKGEAKELVDMLELNTHVSTIEVISMDNHEAVLLGDVLRNTRQITRVNLVHNCEITDPVAVQNIYDRTWCNEQGEILRKIAASDRSITEVRWANRALGDIVALRLARALRSNTVVTVVDVSGNFFRDEGIASLLEVLAVKPHMSFVALPGTSGVTSTAARAAAAAASGDGSSSSSGGGGGGGPKDQGDGAVLADVLNVSVEHAGMLWRAAQTMAWGNVGEAYVNIDPDVPLPHGTTVVDLTSLDEQTLGKRLLEDARLRSRLVCEWRGDTRYVSSEHGVFRLAAPIEESLNSRCRQLEQAVLDTTWQQKHNEIFTGLALNKPECTSIEWGGVGLGDVTAVRLIKNIHMNIYVTNVDLSNNNFSDVVMRELLTAVKTLKTLASLKLLPSPGIGDAELVADIKVAEQTVRDSAWVVRNKETLGQISDNVVHVSELMLSKQGLGDDAAIELATALHSNNVLRKLDLSGNLFGPKGAAALVGVLRSKTSFTELVLLPLPTLTDPAIIQELLAIERAVGQAQLLKLLVRSEDGIMALDSTHFLEGSVRWLLTGPLVFNNSVVDLNLEHCIKDFPQPGSRNECRLVELLASNQMISSVHVDGLNLAPRTVDLVWGRQHHGEFGELLRKVTCSDPALKEVEVPDGIGDLGTLALARALKYNSIVSTIQLGTNRIGHNGSRALLGIVRSSAQQIAILHAGNPPLAREIQSLADRAWCDKHAGTFARLQANDGEFTEVAWPNQSLGNGVAFKIAAAIKNNSSLQKLDLSGNDITEVGVRALLDALAVNSGLRQVKLSQTSIANRVLDQQMREAEERIAARHLLTLAAANSEDVTEISWAGKGITDALIRGLADALMSSTYVTKIELHDDGNNVNRITDDGAAALLPVISSSPTLCELSCFPNKSIRDPGIRRELEALQHDLVDRKWLRDHVDDLERITSDDNTRRGRSFDFEGEGFGDGGAFAIAQALMLGASPSGENGDDDGGDDGNDDDTDAANDAATYAALGLSVGPEDGARAAALSASKAAKAAAESAMPPSFRTGFLGNSHVQSIQLSYNAFGPAGLRALVSALEKCAALTEVALLPSEQAQSDPEAIQLARAFEQKVRDRAWCSTNADMLSRLARNDSSLTELDWSECGGGLGDAVAEALAKALRGNTTLRLVNLSRNKITDVGARALQEALRTNIAAVKLCLLPNELIKSRSVQAELRDMNKFFTGAAWERPRKMACPSPFLGDGNQLHFALPAHCAPNDCRKWLHPAGAGGTDTGGDGMDFTMPVGGPWPLLSADAIRLEQLAPGQAARASGTLSSGAMRLRREQLAVRLSSCPEGALEAFVVAVEENQRVWCRHLEEGSAILPEASD